MKNKTSSAISLCLLSSILLYGCAQASNPADSNSKISDRPVISDPVEDAKNAILRKDYRLLGMATRAIKTPGINPENQSVMIAKCGVRVLPGSGDIIRGKDDLQSKKNLYAYAEKYNRLIKPACIAK